MRIRAARKGFTLATIVVAMMILWSLSAQACTSINVTPGAMVDGSAIVTHANDCGRCSHEIYKVPAKDWPEGSMWEIVTLPQYTDGYQRHEVAEKPTGHAIPQVAHTYGHIRGHFGYINENQVAIGETTIGGRRDFRNANGWLELVHLTMLAVERGESARHAIQVMGEIAEKYGYADSGEMLSVADPNEVWVFEIVGPGVLWEQGSDSPGAFWIAQRIPDGEVAVSANSSVIREVDFNDHENFMFSPGIVEFAVEKGWYNPASGEQFNWRKHFCSGMRDDYSAKRVWRVFSLIAPSLADTLVESDLPFSVPVDKKISVADVFKMHRDHYEGSKYDGSTSLTAGPFNNPRRVEGYTFKVGDVTYEWHRAISLTRCEHVCVGQVRGWLPNEVGGVLWYAGTAADSSCFIPFYVGGEYVSDTMNTKAGSRMEFTRESYWWATAAVMNHVNLMWSYMIKDVNARQEYYENRAFATMEGIDAAATAMLKTNPEQARMFLADYAHRNAYEVRDAWWELLDFLIWKYNSGKIIEDGKIGTLGYPADWLKRVIAIDEPDHMKRP